MATNRSLTAKTANKLSDTLTQLLNGKSTPLPAGWKFNNAKITTIVKQYLTAPGTQAAIKQMLAKELTNIESEYQEALEAMMIGRPAKYRVVSTKFAESVKSKFKPRGSTARTSRWIMAAWGGDWYAYKRSLASRRLVKTGKKDKNNKDIYNVYAGKLGSRGEHHKNEGKKDYYFSVGTFKAGDRAKQYNKTVRSKGAVTLPDSDGSLPDINYTEHQNKVGARAAKQTNQDPKNVPSFAVARAVNLAEQLRNGGAGKSGVKRKHSAPRGTIPYAKTGKMANSYSRTFSFKTSDIAFESVTKARNGNNKIRLTISGNFKPNSMAADYRRVYLRTPVAYKNLLITSAGALFAEVLEDRLYGASGNFKRTK